MLFNARALIMAALLSTLAIALPFDVVPRAKSYEVINVDGGQSTQAPPQETTIVEATKTVEIQSPGPIITQEVTATIVNPAPAPTPPSISSSSRCADSISEASPTWTSISTSLLTNSTSVSMSTTIQTPKPIFITVTVSKDDGPSEYYDDGMWHTRYPIKTFEPAIVSSSPSASVASPTP